MTDKPRSMQVGETTLYEGGSWPPPLVPYEEGEEAVWDSLCRGWGPIPPKLADADDVVA